jgi:hypothetical protein
VGELEPDKDDYGRRKAKILQLGMVKGKGREGGAFPPPKNLLKFLRNEQ